MSPRGAAHRDPRLYHVGRPRPPVVRHPTGNAHMPTDTRLNLTPQFIIGVCLILLGVLLTLDRLQFGRRRGDAAVTGRSCSSRSGGWIVFERGSTGRSLPGYVMIVIGSLLLLNALGRHACSVLGAVLAAHHRACRRPPHHADAYPPARSAAASSPRRGLEPGAAAAPAGRRNDQHIRSARQRPAHEQRQAVPWRRDDGLHGRHASSIFVRRPSLPVSRPRSTFGDHGWP